MAKIAPRHPFSDVAEACDRLGALCRAPKKTQEWAIAYGVAFQAVTDAVAAAPPAPKHQSVVNQAMEAARQPAETTDARD